MNDSIEDTKNSLEIKIDEEISKIQEEILSSKTNLDSLD